MDGKLERHVLWTLLAVLVGLTSGGFAVNSELAPASATRQGCVYDHYVLTSSKKACRPHAKKYPTYVHGAVQRAIYDGALTFGVQYQVLARIAACESSLNPHAVAGSHFGLFQFASFQGASDLKNCVKITSALGRALMFPNVNGCFIQ